MKDSHPSELPKDNDKQGYKFLLDSLREQLLKPRQIEEAVVEQQPEPAPLIQIPKVAFPEGKKYFRIGEVAELLGVETYVLRYWETEFSSIRPKKSRSGQRVYDRRDVEKLATVHHLLHVQKFSLQGAKQRLQEMRKAAQQPQTTPPVDHKVLKELGRDLRSLIAWIQTA